MLKEAGGADVILDNMGAKYLARNVSALATEGRLVVIGMQGGTKGELDLGTLLRKRGAVIATTLRARPTEEKAAICAVGGRARVAADRRGQGAGLRARGGAVGGGRPRARADGVRESHSGKILLAVRWVGSEPCRLLRTSSQRPTTSW